MKRQRPNIARTESADTYDLAEPRLIGPPLPGKVIVAETAEGLIDGLSAEMVAQAQACVRQFGDFHLALSGGSTPQPLYERLMYDPNCRSLPWARTHLWFVDERSVPLDDERSNYRMIKETIVDHSGIPREQVHPIFTDSASADIDYENQLREVMQSREQGQDRLDFVLLGMGDDGHTASLFPFNKALGETQRRVLCIDAQGADPPQRVTMTFPLINAARMIAVLVTGSAKAPTIQRAATGEESSEELPIKGVRPVAGELKWYLDAEAASVET
ncbi:MAG: 6-phosphogluconolactonase [Planctomycetes bacterium]|nr:6-phosphogluconolactonase [Planctomycetota bacterium]